MQKNYTTKEEIWSSTVHGFGILFGIAALTVLTAMSSRFGNAWSIVSSAIFGASMIMLYSASTLYHAITNQYAKKFFKKFDPVGWTIFGIIWGLALIGTVLKLCTPTNGTKIWSIGLYLLMGWMIVFASKTLLSNINTSGLVFLILGGLFYTLGIAFYVWKSKKYTHAIWHFFVLCGTIMHFFAILFGCVLL